MLTNQELVKFAAGNTDFYEAAMSYIVDKERSSEKKGLLQTAFMSEVERKSGVAREGLEQDAWINHPSVQWAALSIANATVRAIIPQTILPQFNLFADMRTDNAGDVVKFRVPARGYCLVSKGGRSERTSFRQHGYSTDVTVAPEERIVTVFAKMYNVLAGKEDIGEMLMWVVASINAAMYGDALNVLTAGLATIPAGALSVTGAFDLKTLVKMGETVQYRNGGVRPVFAGSATALMNVVPDGTSGYRMNVDGEGNGKVELMRSIMGFDVLKLDNAVGADGQLILPDNKIYVVSPSQDKLLKGVLSTKLTNSNDFYMNADITSNFTQRISYAFAYASSAYAGIYTIQ